MTTTDDDDVRPAPDTTPSDEPRVEPPESDAVADAPPTVTPRRSWNATTIVLGGTVALLAAVTAVLTVVQLDMAERLDAATVANTALAQRVAELEDRLDTEGFPMDDPPWTRGEDDEDPITIQRCEDIGVDVPDGLDAELYAPQGGMFCLVD